MTKINPNQNIFNPAGGEQSVVRSLARLIGIYRKKYIHQEPDLFSGWRTVEHYLTDQKIEAGIFNQAILGIFLSVFPTAFCVDIDDHLGKGEGYLLSVYQRVISHMAHNFPSILCRTPHGLHAYYFLEYPVHVNVLIPEVRNLVKDLPVEVKPTHTVGARVPRAGSLLDPVSLEPISEDFKDVIISATQYHPAEVFTDQIEPRTLRKALKGRRVVALGIRESRTLAKFEAQCISTGRTNQFLCDLIPMYRASGLSPEEAALRYSALLDESYFGELREFPRLLSRVKSFYRNPPASRFNTLSRNKQLDFFTEVIAERISGMVEGPTETMYQKQGLTQKKNTVKKAVLYLENWKNFIDEVKKDRVESEFWNYLYPFFKKNTSEGFYPIPRNLFKKLHEHYELWLLPHLKETGYLEKSPYGYSNAPDKTSCYHWRINGGSFL
jgi:hypothetical protein